MLGYIIALVPLYIFIYLPLSEIIWGSKSSSPLLSTLNSSFIATDELISCPAHDYQTFILSHEPLIIYIEGFISPEESRHLVAVSLDKYSPSTITTGSETSVDPSIRHSEVALLDRDDVVRCIEHRARAFQGWKKDLLIERLRTQRYGTGGHYTHHYDWSGASRVQDRVSTFMVYVDTHPEIQGGETEFPRMRMPMKRGRWCEFLVCAEGEEREMGVVFKPIKGNAVFWENLRADGMGFEETWHAGLPVKEGWKVGLNIWSWGPAREIS
ncbi:hypothetical protein B7494_g8208 [Chlorociboria aeruginascens]|nr:hypothetical protein B7494_g8208 [Chlorociboria aeruginascens]